MHVPAEARRSVMFLGEVTAGKFIPRATAFLVMTGEREGDTGTDDHFPYLVTAEHVIVGMAHKQKEVFARFNLKDGTAHVQSIQSVTWWYHPTAPERTDVALCPVAFDWGIVDHAPIPLFNFDPHENAPIFQPRHQIGLGDETFAIGLFRSHHGAQRNIPIVRIGNIAAMPEEPIKTRHGGGFIDGYLVEMRSIAGLSGSPVFVDRPEVPPFGFMPDPRFRPDPERVNWYRYHFLGLIHGHFDVPNPIEDMFSEEDSSQSIGVNTGMGVVVPAKMVMETLYQQDLHNERQVLLEQYKQRGATRDH